MAEGIRIKGIQGGRLTTKLKIPLSRDVLDAMGECMVKVFARESKKDFAKRGWSGEAQDGSAPIWDSFSYAIRGAKTIELLSTFPFLSSLTSGDRPPEDMVWLTQEAKNKHPENYPLTPAEKKLRMNRSGRVFEGERLPLVVPLKKGATVIFRTAPLTFQDAWIHPGIAKFTFAQRAAKMSREECAPLMIKAAMDHLVATSQ